MRRPLRMIRFTLRLPIILRLRFHILLHFTLRPFRPLTKAVTIAAAPPRATKPINLPKPSTPF